MEVFLCEFHKKGVFQGRRLNVGVKGLGVEGNGTYETPEEFVL